MQCAQRTSKIRGRVLEILTSYLQGRRARTAVEGEFSEFVHISAGITEPFHVLSTVTFFCQIGTNAYKIMGY